MYPAPPGARYFSRAPTGHRQDAATSDVPFWPWYHLPGVEPHSSHPGRWFFLWLHYQTQSKRSKSQMLWSFVVPFLKQIVWLSCDYFLLVLWGTGSGDHEAGVIWCNLSLCYLIHKDQWRVSRHQLNLPDWLSFHTLWISLIFLLQSHSAMDIHQFLKVSSAIFGNQRPSWDTYTWLSSIYCHQNSTSIPRQFPWYIDGCPEELFSSCQQHRKQEQFACGSREEEGFLSCSCPSLIFINSFIYWRIDLLIHWFVHWFTDSSMFCSLIHWFNDSFPQYYSDLFSDLVIPCSHVYPLIIQSVMHVFFIWSHWHLNRQLLMSDAPHNFSTTSLLNSKISPLGF